jgi:hypothetical protein
MWMIAAVLICTVLFSQQSVPKPSCIIASRHQHKFGENMSRLSPHKGLDYIEGEYPQGIKFHSELSDKLVQQIQERGGHIVILKRDYSQAELEDARKQCATFQGSAQPTPTPKP